MTQNLLLLTSILFTQSAIIFFLSRQNFKQLFFLLRKIFHHEKTVYRLISLIFLPGTIVHELSHFFAAIVLFLPVKEIRIFPQFENNQLKLGHVLYAKKDFLRGILVGIAPFFGALLFFFILAFFRLFPSNNLGLNIALIYLIFAVSSVMFSSKQDLVDIVYLIPLIILLWIIVYIFQPSFSAFHLPYFEKIVTGLKFFLNYINFYLFLSIIIHLFLMIIFWILNRR